MMTVESIRKVFGTMLSQEKFVTDKSGVKTLEIVGSSFSANQDVIFGKQNPIYVENELAWYKSQSRNVYDIPGIIPQIWKNVATKDGLINSNYGWAIYSKENNHQYLSCINQLIEDKNSRRAIMIYTRPEMQSDYNKDGMSDFMCTNSVQYIIRNNALTAIVNMRSNDAIFGYRNDIAWQEFVLGELFQDLLDVYPELQLGDIIWQTGSIHIYERHFYLVDYYNRSNQTGIDIPKDEYCYMFPLAKYK